MQNLKKSVKTEEGSPQDDDSYLGYSVATREFNGDGDNLDVVVGMPRGANLTGKVITHAKFRSAFFFLLLEILLCF